MNTYKKKCLQKFSLIFGFILASFGSLCAMQSPKNPLNEHQNQIKTEYIRANIILKYFCTTQNTQRTHYKIEAYTKTRALKKQEQKIGEALFQPSCFKKSFFLDRLDVHQEHQAKGIGSALLNSCKEWALQLGATTLELEALPFRSKNTGEQYEQDLERLVTFYKKHGAAFADEDNKYDTAALSGKKMALMEINLTPTPEQHPST